MKRSSFRRRNALLSGRGTAAVAATACLAALIILVSSFAPGFLPALVSPLWRAGDAATASVHNASAELSSKGALMRERDEALAERDALTLRNAALAAEVADLARLVGSRTEPGARILAGVLARPPVSPYDVLVVDQGSDAGVVAGALAYGAGGTPIGTVASMTGASARILLFSAPGRQTAAWAGEARVAVMLRGQGSGAFTAVVPRDAGLHEGDSIYVAGPGALPIGTIVRVADDPSSPESSVTIRPLTNPFSITWVELSRGAGL